MEKGIRHIFFLAYLHFCISTQGSQVQGSEVQGSELQGSEVQGSEVE